MNIYTILLKLIEYLHKTPLAPAIFIIPSHMATNNPSRPGGYTIPYSEINSDFATSYLK